MEKLSLRTLEVQEMEKIEGGSVSPCAAAGWSMVGGIFVGACTGGLIGAAAGAFVGGIAVYCCC